ncbi:STAS domain-containing protein [Polaromonas sp. YR568]|uniref:STAS domain-containing protein n=1 Tax=Polaromonas sp. YR568 TaxID=1855301 RepID=UPI003137C73C
MILLPADLTHDRAAAFSGTIAGQVAAQAGPVVADAGSMTAFDSSALAVLLECRRQAVAAGRGFVVQNLPPKLRQLAGLYGVEELLPAAEATSG